MEPASPLKSITNTAQLSSSQQKQQTVQSNGVSTTTNGVNNKTIEENNSNLWSTPATATATLNGNNHLNMANNSRKQNPYRIDLFSLSTSSSTSINDNNNLFSNGNSNTNTNNSHMTKTNGISLNNGINLSSSDNGFTNGFHGNGHHFQQKPNVITKNNFDLHQQLSTATTSNIDNNNLFTPDSDFVADFSSANIFNAMNNPSNNGNSSNGIASKAIHLNGITNGNGNHINGIDKLANGNQSNGSNGFTTANGFNDVANENFADFEHNTIYNAAGKLAKQKNSFYFIRLS